ncbi:hypothetical protein PR048_033668 [Dryococelus australis]|uniref:THAP-type domain-containing protein n=1 Tax=Dryococelus australis TaxID=614101 RepID=A0ABQ9G514_9NEOP|nr:hypothetical protein PR048_033668 [Dryococelus australis]
MPACAVQNCRNYSRKIGSAVRYHRFPNDLVTRGNWIFPCERKGGFKADTSSVCSVHFSENDYREIFKIKRKGILKTDMAPPLLITNVTERLNNRTVKRKLVPDLTEMRERKRYQKIVNASNRTLVVTQGLNGQTMCRPGPSTRHKRHSENTFYFRKLN